jgi:hypothetical protein
MAFVGFLLLWFMAAGVGLVGRIPVVGEAVLGVLWGVSLLIGFLMAAVAVIVCAGWPLMIAAISVESSDGFDGLSRANTYVTNRPGYALFLVLFAVTYGGLLLYFVAGVTELAVELSMQATDAGSGESINEMIRPAINLGEGMVEPVSGPGYGLTQFWARLARMLPTAFVYSYFWTAATIIYLLLRRREDGTPLAEIQPNDSRSGERPAPLVGMAAATERERQIAADSGKT